MFCGGQTFGVRRRLAVLPEDLLSLQPGCPVQGQVINAFFRLIERRSVFYRGSLPSVWALDTRFLIDWQLGRIEEPEHFRALGLHLLNFEYVLIPVHLPDCGPNGHWSLVVVRPLRLEIRAYDSIRLPRDLEMKAVLDFLRRYAQVQARPFLSDAWTLIDTPKYCPQQRDNMSCGAYVCAYADILTRNSSLTESRIDITRARGQILKIIEQGRFKAEDFPLEPGYTQEAEVAAAAFSFAAFGLSLEEAPEAPRICLDAAERPGPSVSAMVPSAEEIDEPEDDDIIQLHDEELESELGVTTGSGEAQPDLRPMGAAHAAPVEPATSGPPLVIPARKNDPNSLVVITDEILAKLADVTGSKNHKTKIFRPDGSFFRIRTKKLKRLVDDQQKRK